MQIILCIFCFLVLFLNNSFAQTQPSVRQQGSVSNGHIVVWQGNNLIKDGGNPPGSGTVTSVGASSDGILFSSTISGSPITSSGTFAFSPLSHAANTFYSSPNGSSGTPTFRAIVAADLPVATSTTQGIVTVPINNGLNLSGGSLTLSQPTTSVLGGILAQSSATSNSWVQYIDTTGTQHLAQPNFNNISGTVSIGEGGTGLTTLGSANTCLQVNGAGTSLIYANCSGGGTVAVTIGTSLTNNNPANPSDGSSGIYSAGTHLVGIVTNALERFRVSTGVAIGTSYVATTPPTDGAIIAGNVAIGTSALTASSSVTIGGNLAFVPTTNGIRGTATNDNASSGLVGEYLSSTVAAGSAVSLTSGSAANVTSLSLTAGDWEVSGWIVGSPSGSTSTSAFDVWVSTTSALFPSLPTAINIYSSSISAGNFVSLPTGSLRLSIASTTTVYLSVVSSFSGGSLGAYGILQARRVR